MLGNEFCNLTTLLRPKHVSSNLLSGHASNTLNSKYSKTNSFCFTPQIFDYSVFQMYVYEFINVLHEED